MQVAVIGCGVVGLSAAIRLREAGCDVTCFAPGPSSETTSARAGAIFTPTEEGGNADWFRESIRSFREIERASPESGVRFAALREYARQPAAALPWWTELVDAPRRIAVAEGGAYGGAFETIVPHVDMTCYLDWLSGQAERMGIRRVRRTIGSFDELSASEYSLIVNCTGLGARSLAADEDVRPIRGQVLHVSNEIGLTRSLLAEIEGGVGSYLFAFPRHIVLGGTYERDVWEAATEPEQLELIAMRCGELLRADGHPGWESLAAQRLRALAGLRPARIVGGRVVAPRVEAERIGGRWVIHNYGHGRSGVTLSWGCAAVVRAMALERTGS